MPASNAITGYGTTFEIDDGTGSFDLIAEVSNLDPPDPQSDEIETSHMMSPDQTREFMKGMTDAGEMSFDINWIPNDATDVILRALRASGARRTMKITWPNLGTWTFSGWIKGFKASAPFDDKMSASVSVRVVSSISFA